MDANQTIRNLEMISTILGTAANKPENYNTEWAYYLEQVSFSLLQNAEELKELVYLFNMTL